MTKSNEFWNQLCAIADTLVPQYRGRPDALQAAIRQHPDLAAKAIDPTGKPVIGGSAALETGAAAGLVAPVTTQKESKSWHDVLRAIGIAKDSEPPSATGVQPWRAILSELGLTTAPAPDSATERQRPARETPSTGARPWGAVLREIEREGRAAR